MKSARTRGTAPPRAVSARPGRLELQVRGRRSRLLAIALAVFGALVVVGSANPASAGEDSWSHPWAGVVYQGVKDSSNPDSRPWETLSRIEADIKIPCLAADAPDGSYHAWIGLGGWNSGSFLRAGISAEMSHLNGSPVGTYSLWAQSRWWPSFVHVPPPVRESRPTAAPREVLRISGASNSALCEHSFHVAVNASGFVTINDNAGGGIWNKQMPRAADVTTGEFIVQATPGALTLVASGHPAFYDAKIIGPGEHIEGAGHQHARAVPTARNLVPVAPTLEAPTTITFRMPPYRLNPRFPG